MKLREMPRLLRTVRHLRCSQLAWRGRYFLERRFVTPRVPSAVSGTEVREDFPEVPVLHRPGPSSPIVVRQLAEGRFEHLNECRHLGRFETDWRLGACRSGRLWVITLHYHAWAHALAEQAGNGDKQAEELLRHYLQDWILRCPLTAPGARELAWNSFAIATRLTWWIRSYLAVGVDAWRSYPEFESLLLGSLRDQAAYLHEHLEWDLRANHLLRDAVGLAWAGRFLRGEQPQRWLRTATEIARQQAIEQVADDGSHFERSPMYHVQVMEDFFALALLLEEPAAKAQMRATWQAMAEYLGWMRHADGGIPLFNDGGLRSAAHPERMLEAGRRLGVHIDSTPRNGGRRFAQAGVIAWHASPWNLFFDVGHLGPDYNPAHGHADTLTIEASYDGHRLLVDPGTFHYDDDQRRASDRATSSHNTVCINETNSSEVWGIFRVGRRAHPEVVREVLSDDSISVTATHDGYDYLPGNPRHERSVSATRNGPLTIVDRLSSRGACRAAGGFLLAPDWNVETIMGGWRLSLKGIVLTVSVNSSAALQLSTETADYHPEYGLRLETNRLIWRYEGTLPIEVQIKIERREA